MAKKRMNNLGDLKQLKFRKEKEDVYSLPYKKNEPPKEKVNPEDDTKEQEIFLAAMQGVQRMDGESGRQVSPAVQTAAAQQLSEEDQARNDLERFMRGDIEFELEYTEEYMYGYVRGLDIKTFQQLKNGSLSVAGHLDLHGMTSDQARDSLLFFIRESYLQGHRCVLVVTGRGKNSPGGQPILRTETETWLTKEPLRRVVLAFCTAQPKDGGAGALYVLLRRQKKTEGKVQWDRMMNWDD
ncbi:Smr/MutS family protein [Pseudodesulfovibrio indicus]|uniref:DNA mismatch repair protein MutS n=1 Tax=Pseudodesulfovibrio indicus TaxID=1716143 RepID=A0A126QQ37_9BACT|nr:Smr/MutS family protein [Pseudodesulfovibrio indicus]AMK11846.1 DNA mismatch repair protein MutS [Pseudodesulfovibrio indicus]TDT88388.1 DNA-nicking Smr family endonuclease [Pseudodesulfovibrio indicus]